MIELNVGQMFACMRPIMSVAAQDMGMEDAERIAGFLDVYIEKMGELEERRNAMLDVTYSTDAEKEKAFGEFAQEKVEVPEINFKDFSGLRISPDSLVTLKRAGLFTKTFDS